MHFLFICSELVDIEVSAILREGPNDRPQAKQPDQGQFVNLT